MLIYQERRKEKSSRKINAEIGKADSTDLK